MYMKFDSLVNQAGSLPFFDLALITQVSGENKRSLTIQMYQWAQKGKVLPLRRGFYTLANNYRRVPLSPTHLANEMVHPSYLSSTWVLGFYGLIPEKVAAYTSVTTRVTRQFNNAFGRFIYSSFKKDFFWGFRELKFDGSPALIAEPEKALLDYWHLHPGEWSPERMSEMRFQNFEMVNSKKLEAYAQRWDSPRLIRLAGSWQELSKRENEGVIEL